MALVAEIEEKLAAMRLDALLCFGEVVDLEAEMMRANEARALLDVRGLAAGRAGEIEQREVDHAVGHVDRRADLQILAADALEIEDLGVELRRLIEVFHADCKMAQTCHGSPPHASPLGIARHHSASRLPQATLDGAMP